MDGGVGIGVTATRLRWRGAGGGGMKTTTKKRTLTAPDAEALIGGRRPATTRYGALAAPRTLPPHRPSKGARGGTGCATFFVFSFLFLSSFSWLTSGRCPAEYRCTVRTRMQKARGKTRGMSRVEGGHGAPDWCRAEAPARFGSPSGSVSRPPASCHRGVGRSCSSSAASIIRPAARPPRTSLATSLSSPPNLFTPFRSCDAAASPLVPPLPLLLSSSPPPTPSLLCPSSAAGAPPWPPPPPRL